MREMNNLYKETEMRCSTIILSPYLGSKSENASVRCWIMLARFFSTIKSFCHRVCLVWRRMSRLEDQLSVRDGGRAVTSATSATFVSCGLAQVSTFFT